MGELSIKYLKKKNKKKKNYKWFLKFLKVFPKFFQTPKNVSQNHYQTSSYYVIIPKIKFEKYSEVLKLVL